MIRQILSVGILCALMVPYPVLAAGAGSFYGKFRPLEGATDTAPATRRDGRYVGETGYYRPESRPGIPQVIQPGYRDRRTPGAAIGRYGMPPRQEPQGPRFRPDQRRRNSNGREPHPVYRVQPGPGPGFDPVPQPGQGNPGYRFRPQGHS